METFPGTLLESCVSRLSASIQEIITADVIPDLFDRVFKHLNEFPMTSSKSEKLQDFVNDRFDSLQDIVIGLNSDNTSEIENVSTNVKNLEHEMSSSLRSMRVLISESEEKENMRFEQNKRRLGDFHSSINTMNSKLDFYCQSSAKE
jgi:gas vesicle protein